MRHYAIAGSPATPYLALAGVLAATWAGTQDAPASGRIEMKVRDSATGRAVAASVRATEPGGRVATAPVDRSGRHVFQLAAGSHRFEVTADRYQPLETRFDAEADGSLPVTVWLDPQSPPEELRPRTIASKLAPGFALLHGHVVDAVTGLPVEAATVRLAGTPLRASTDRRGYFLLRAPAARVAGPDDTPAAGELSLEARGYKRHLIADAYLMDGQDTHFLVEMNRGEGEERQDERHRQSMDCDEVQLPPPSDAEEQVEAASGLAPLAAPGASLAVPGSIRVGLGCSCRDCSSVSVMSMQTYVKRGLDDEWIASWHGNALRAGAVAYRSYGAWHVANPIRSNYDICSTACCQVNDTSTVAATNAAGDETNGIVLERGGAIFRAEYSAENNAWDNPNDGLSCVNNDRSCGNGNAGSPANSWPCLPEPLCRDRGCHGHGRGMCQWGTQRWASQQGRDWRWITGNYYNNCGRPGGLRSANLSPGCTVVGAIGAKYNGLGNACGFLGMCVTSELTTADGVGRYNHFQGGSIYWTPSTGAHEVHGGIRAKWEQFGWERGLGYPTTDETATPDGRGRYNHFTLPASIYWTPQTGAHEVHGAIRDKWASMGWERSCLGYPTSDEFDSAGGRRNNFERGHIFWTAAGGAVAHCN